MNRILGGCTAAAVMLALSTACSEQGSTSGPLGIDSGFGGGLEPAASSTTIDFEEFGMGDVVTSSEGVAISVENEGATCTDDAVAFDTDNPVGNAVDDLDLDDDLDPDLDLDIILIILEDETILPDGVEPDDCAAGGTFAFDFSGVSATGVQVASLDIKDTGDTETGGVTIRAFDATNSQIGGDIVGPSLANGEEATVAVDRSGVVRLDVVLTGSGGVDNLVFTPPMGNEGCTPGFFRNNLTSWPGGAEPGDDFDTTLMVDWFDPDISLLDALVLKGGGLNALARHTAAAYLNALGGFYPLATGEVKDLAGAVDINDPAAVEALKDLFEGMNELGCPLDGDGNADGPPGIQSNGPQAGPNAQSDSQGPPPFRGRGR